MRIGNIIGTVTLSRKIEELDDGRYLIVQPYHGPALRGKEKPSAETVVIYDELGAGVGTIVAFSEGREGAMPFVPDKVPTDAYCSALLDSIELTEDRPSESEIDHD